MLCIPGEIAQLAGEVTAGRYALVDREVELQNSRLTVQQLEVSYKRMQGEPLPGPLTLNRRKHRIASTPAYLKSTDYPS